jgi:lipopolysaccharide heptosyltransferase I
LRPGKAIRNFKTALKLLRCGIEGAKPLAAIQQKRYLLTIQSIYISEYLENSPNLYAFASGHTGRDVRKQLCRQLAVILAELHKNGLWHRDSKATNFIVCKDKILLVDMDGIKPYLLRRRSRQLRSLWQLAASVMTISAVNRTDYLRTFTTYCNLVGLEIPNRRRVFRKLSSRAKAKHLRSMIKNILIIKPSSLGDIVMALPTLSALRRSFPNARISWFVRPEFEPILKNHPHLTDIILFDRRFLGKAWYNWRAFASLLSLIRQLRRGKFDAVFDLQGLFRTASLSWLSGCKKRFGMANARELAHIFYTHKIEQDRDCIHLVDYYLRIAQNAGVCDTEVQFVLPANSVAADSANRLLINHNVNSNSYAVFIPTSAHSDKCWPIERFAALADRISSQFGFSIIAAGTTAERGYVEKLKAAANVPIANFAGRTGLAELVALLKSAKLVVSNDTGPGHIAAALGTPLVLIFGRSNPARVAPYGRSHCVVAIEPDSRGFKADSTDPKHDIKAITVDWVYQKICENVAESVE